MSTYNYRLAQAQEQANPGLNFNYQNQPDQTQPMTQPQSMPNQDVSNLSKQKEKDNQLINTWYNAVMSTKQGIINTGRLGLSLSRNPAVSEFVVNELPKILRFEQLESWVTGILERRLDVIFNNLKSTKLGRIATNPEIQRITQLLRDQMMASIGNKLGTNGQQVLELLRQVKAAKAARPFNVLNTISKIDDLVEGLTEAQKAFQASGDLVKNSPETLGKFQKAIPELTAAKQALLESQTAEDIVKNTENLKNIINKNKYLFQFIENNKFLSSSLASTLRGAFGKETGIAAAATKTIEQSLYDSQKAKNALQMAAKFGKNPSAGRVAAVEAINVLKSAVLKIPALRGLANALNFVGRNMPIIDMLISSADYIQFIDEMRTGKVKLDDPEHPEYIPLFIFSSFKMLLSISMVVAPPLIPILLPFDIAVSALQIAGPAAAEQLGSMAGGAGWGGKEKIDEMNRINEQAVGTPPSNPDAKIVYDWIEQNGKMFDYYRNVTKTFPYNQWATQYPIIVQKTINDFYNMAPDNIIDSAHSKVLGGAISWLKNTNDTRYQELNQSLLGLLINSVKEAKQFVRQENQAQNQAQQQQPTTANKVYNNRRYVICPST